VEPPTERGTSWETSEREREKNIERRGDTNRSISEVGRITCKANLGQRSPIPYQKGRVWEREKREKKGGCREGERAEPGDRTRRILRRRQTANQRKGRFSETEGKKSKR